MNHDAPSRSSAEDSLRIVSLLPSATEMICALGLEESLMGITHCCDYPPSILQKPRVVHGAIPVDSMSLKVVDAAVSEHLHQGKSLYTLDEVLLAKIQPTLLVTQDLCQVCAPSGKEVDRTLGFLSPPPKVLWMSPHSIADIHDNIRELGEAAGRVREAESLIAEGKRRLDSVAAHAAKAPHRPRVFCAEWVDPLYCSGHWVPEMVEIAGGVDVLGRKWKDSVRAGWDDLKRAAPDWVIIMSCGFDCINTAAHARWFLEQPNAQDLPAVRKNQVYAVDAGYFSRPGPRVVAGAELLAHLLHPDHCEWTGDPAAFRRIECRPMAPNAS